MQINQSAFLLSYKIGGEEERAGEKKLSLLKEDLNGDLKGIL